MPRAHRNDKYVRRRGQQRLRTVEERLAPQASAARAKITQEGQASLARAEVAQEKRDEEMTDACVTNNAEKVKPEESREDSTTVCGNKSRSGSGGLGRGDETRACCEKHERSVCCERRGHA